MEPSQVDVVAEHADILQVGTRNMQNYSLLTAVGKADKPVMLKRGYGATIEEWLMAAEYIISSGQPNVILCERGIRTFETYTRNTLDLTAVARHRQALARAPDVSGGRRRRRGRDHGGGPPQSGRRDVRR
jgi:3-deoxy-7-phosphoheptulonate synthase